MQLKWLNYFQLLIFEEIDSTNNEAKRLLNTNQIEDKLVIWAYKQTAGRGRYSRTWESLEGNLFLSIILPKTELLERMMQLSFVTSLAISEAITESALTYNKIINTQHKWPNDVLVNGKKIAGILIETGGKNDKYLIVGIGLNVVTHPALLSTSTTNLQESGCYFIESNNILTHVMDNFLTFYTQWLSSGFSPIREKWLQRAINLNKIITVKTATTSISGIFLDIDFTGALRLQLASGQIYTVQAGEVFFTK